MVGMRRRHKRFLQVAADILLIWLALALAFILRLGSADQLEPVNGHLWLFITAPLIAIPIFIRIGMYRAVLRYMGNDALVTIAKAVTLASLFLALAVYLYREPPALVPRSLIFIYWGLNLLLVGGLRLGMRQYFMGDWHSLGSVLTLNSRDATLPKVAVYGAGAAGNQLVGALRMGRMLNPVAFIDDDENVVNRVIAGIKVYKPSRINEMIEETGAQEVLLAMPSVSRSRRRDILEDLESYPLLVRTIPGFMDLASGKVEVDDLQEVDIADLLGRDAVPPDQSLLQRCIREKAVMVTGAGGSIGSELCRQIILCVPKTLVLFEHSEFALYEIHSELTDYIRIQKLDVSLIPILGSVRNCHRLEDVMSAWQINTVYHAAAYKHVPMVEHNVAEGIMNNVFGTLNTAQAAIKCSVDNFVLISTDKAVRPTNVMGSTKRLAEMVLQGLSAEQVPRLWGKDGQVDQLNRTRFTMVRFGNVLGSSGSVIPLFREQIRRGGPITVTHPDITRYFMTITEAAQLVIQAGSMGEGGDVFVLDMGEPVSIVDLARKMTLLSGLTVRDESNTNGDISISFTGLRPGEKLYEELLIGDNPEMTAHEKIYRANDELMPWDRLLPVLDELRQAIRDDDYESVRRMLLETVQGYEPTNGIVDLLYRQSGLNLK
jgi:FlaA1/EpsC-like NDP-sugar epimerase